MPDSAGAHFARTAMCTSLYRLGPAGEPPPVEDDAMTAAAASKPPEGAVALMRMVDFRIPLPWLMSGFIVAVGAVIAMYYQLQGVSETLKDVRTVMSQQTELLQRLTSQQALLQYRVEKLEAADRRVPLPPVGK